MSILSPWVCTCGQRGSAQADTLVEAETAAAIKCREHVDAAHCGGEQQDQRRD